MRSPFFRKQAHRQSLAVEPAAKPARSRLSSTTCPTWTDETRRDLDRRLRQELCRQAASVFRLIIEPNGCNGWSRHQTDGRQITTVRNVKIGRRVGRPGDGISYGSISEDGVPRHGRIT
nr:hypothetical protein [Bradyrhizobium murdochi]